jgi:hypothetical protein
MPTATDVTQPTKLRLIVPTKDADAKQLTNKRPPALEFSQVDEANCPKFATPQRTRLALFAVLPAVSIL